LAQRFQKIAQLNNF